jgi:hypothetical protein
MKNEEKGLCWVRKDLLKKGLCVPIGDVDYYCGEEPLKYHYTEDDEIFEVFFCGKWQEADSIDFDFESALK